MQPVPIHKAQTIFTFKKLFNPTYLIWFSHPSSLVAWLPVHEPALAWIMTHDHAKDMRASELGPLSIWALQKFSCLID